MAWCFWGIILAMPTHMNNPAASIDAFIAQFPPEIQQVLESVRQTIHHAAPDAQEKISYGIPTFTLKGNLVHFSAYQHHIGFYPGAQAIVDFADDLKPYETSKGTVKFPLDKPIPLDLIKKITEYRVQANQAKAAKK